MTPSTATTQVKGQNRSIKMSHYQEKKKKSSHIILHWLMKRDENRNRTDIKPRVVLSFLIQADIIIHTLSTFTAMNQLTGPHSDMVQWRSQGGPVQFLMFGGLVIGSHGLVSSEHRTSRVTWALRPHLAGHWMEVQTVYVISFLPRKRSGMAHTSVHSATSHCGPQAGLLQGRLSMGRSRSAMVQSSL